LRYLCRDDRTELKRQLLCPFLRVFMAQSRFFWAEYLVLDFEPGPDQEGRMASCGFRPSVPFSFFFSLLLKSTKCRQKLVPTFSALP
jgi:hypothetical protein